MTWFPVLLMICLALDAIGYVGRVRKPRMPVTPAMAVAEVIVNGLLILGIDRFILR